jgi:hypothetical protein
VCRSRGLQLRTHFHASSAPAAWRPAARLSSCPGAPKAISNFVVCDPYPRCQSRAGGIGKARGLHPRANESCQHAYRLGRRSFIRMREIHRRDTETRQNWILRPRRCPDPTPAARRNPSFAFTRGQQRFRSSRTLALARFTADVDTRPITAHPRIAPAEHLE